VAAQLRLAARAEADAAELSRKGQKNLVSEAMTAVALGCRRFLLVLPELRASGGGARLVCSKLVL
jgi:hypothetical protein